MKHQIYKTNKLDRQIERIVRQTLEIKKEHFTDVYATTTTAAKRPSLLRAIRKTYGLENCQLFKT